MLAEEPQSFDACFGDFATVLDNANGDVEGQTARAVSDNYTFTAASDDGDHRRCSTSGRPQDMVAAGVITVDDAHTQVLDQFVSQLSSPDTAACIEGQIAEKSAITVPTIPELTGVSLPDLSSMIPQIDVHATPDLGVGDASGRLDLGISTNVFGIAIDLTCRCSSPAPATRSRTSPTAPGPSRCPTSTPRPSCRPIVDALA